MTDKYLLHDADVNCFEAPVDMSKSNAALANALSVQSYPCCQVFRQMKLSRSLPACSPEAVMAAVEAASKLGNAQEAADDARPGAAAHSGRKGHPNELEQGSKAEGIAAPSGADRVYAPLTGKGAKAGAMRLMPGGATGYYW